MVKRTVVESELLFATSKMSTLEHVARTPLSQAPTSRRSQVGANHTTKQTAKVAVFTGQQQRPQQQQQQQEKPHGSAILVALAPIRGFLSVFVEKSVPYIPYFQTRRNAFLDFYCNVATFLGDKAVYLFVCPLLFWIGGCDLARQFTLMAVIGTYLGNFWKNLFALPRPRVINPNIWTPPLQAMYDYGMPSIHSMNSITIPLFFMFYLQWFTLTSFLFTLWFSLSIAFSRMYLGVHSPADVIVGLLSGVVYLFLWWLTWSYVDNWIITSANLPAILAIFVIVAITIHPRSTLYSSAISSAPNPTYGDSCALIGIISGIVLGTWLYPQGLAWATSSSICPVLASNVPLRGLIAPIALLLDLNPSATYLVTRATYGFLSLLVMKCAAQFTTMWTLKWLFNFKSVKEIAECIAKVLVYFSIPYFADGEQAACSLSPALQEKVLQQRGKQSRIFKTTGTYCVVKYFYAFAVGISVSNLTPCFFDCLGI